MSSARATGEMLVDLGSHRPNPAREDGAVGAVIVAHQIRWHRFPRKGLDNLLRQPLRRRMPGHRIPQQLSSSVADNDEGKQALEVHARIERFFNRAKNSRRVATRYDKLIESFAASVLLACIRIWIKFASHAKLSLVLGRRSMIVSHRFHWVSSAGGTGHLIAVDWLGEGGGLAFPWAATTCFPNKQ